MCVSRCSQSYTTPCCQPYKKSPNPAMSGFCGENHKVLGMVDLKITIGEYTTTHPFHVLAGLQYPMLIGKDFFYKHGAVLDFKEKEIRFEQPNIPSVKIAKTTDYTFLRCKEKISIPANHEVIIPVRVPLHMTNQTLLIEDTPALKKHSLIGIHSIMTSNSEHANVCRLYNPTEKTVTMPAGTIVASASKIDANDIEMPSIDKPQYPHVSANKTAMKSIAECRAIVRELGIPLLIQI